MDEHGWLTERFEENRPRLRGVAYRADPEAEAVLADSVAVALLVVLDMLTPAERLAFVLHDLFAMPFEEIGPIVGRSMLGVVQRPAHEPPAHRPSPVGSGSRRSAPCACWATLSALLSSA